MILLLFLPLCLIVHSFTCVCVRAPCKLNFWPLSLSLWLTTHRLHAVRWVFFFCLCLSCDICLKINWRHELKERDEKKTNSNLRMVKFKCFYSLVWKHVSFSLHLNYIKSQLKWAKIMNFILIRDTWSFGMQIAVVFGIWDSAAFEAKLCWSLASLELASD